MKILLLSDYGTPTGGAEMSVIHLRAGLRARGHDARLFASRAGTDRVASVADWHCAGTTSRWRTLLQTANISARRQLRAVLAEFQPDVVHVRMFLTQLSPQILPLLRTVPAVFHVAWYRPICPTGTKLLPDGSACAVDWGGACYRQGCLPLRDWPVLMWQMRSWWRQRGVFRRVVVESEAMWQALAAAGWPPTDLIYPGEPARAQRPPLRDPPQVAYAGRLVREKGVAVLLHALSRVPGAGLVIIGDGPDRERLQRLTGELGLTDRVTFTGQLVPAEAEQRLASAWVQVVPSVWAEPFGLVAVEAARRGTAAVVSRTGGLVEIVEHEQTGLHVPPGDADALATALRRLLADRALAEELGRAARERARRLYTDTTYVDRFLKLYTELGRPTAG